MQFFHLEGYLHLRLDEQVIKIECEGQSVRLTFSSLKALKKFIHFNKVLNQQFSPLSTQKWATSLHLTYYLTNFFIGESRSDLQPSWLGSYLGLERSKFYPRQLLNYLYSIPFKVES
jgi:hypothetical protein